MTNEISNAPSEGVADLKWSWADTRAAPMLDSDDDSLQHSPSPETPKIIGRYQIEDEIGEGNWGKVKRAIDTATGQPLAVKIFFRPKLSRKIKDGVARLYYEYELVRGLKHPNVIEYHEIFESGQKIYLVMGLGGQGLDVIAESQPERITPAFVRTLLTQLLTALAYLDSQSIAHHDIKPANLLVDDEDRLLLCDFGVAERYEKVVGCQSFFGTPAFQPPEIAGNISGATFDGTKADIWSIGVVLFYLVTNRYPFAADTVYLLMKAIEEQPVMLPETLDPSLYDLLSSTDISLSSDAIFRIAGEGPAEAHRS